MVQLKKDQIWVCNWPNPNGTTIPVIFQRNDLGGVHYLRATPLRMAAPELLEALIILRKSVSNQATVHQREENIKLIDEAIAKATGVPDHKARGE